MKNRYQTMMEDIHTPAGLNERVLLAARRQTAERAEPKHLAKRRVRPVLRAAVCAACALALALGTVRFYPAERADVSGDGEPGSTVMLPTLSFGLAAYAAETGELTPAGEDGRLVMGQGSGAGNEEFGHFTGCLFRVTGERIRTVSLSVDRGGLYRSRILTDLTDEQVREYLSAWQAGAPVYSVYGEDEDGPMNAEEMVSLGASVTEAYDPEASYGFWVPPELYGMEEGDGNLPQFYRDSIDTFDGAVLTVTVTFTDGTEQTQAYRLSTGKLLVEYEDGYMVLLPEWAEGEEPYSYGIMAVPETANTESRFYLLPYGGDMAAAWRNASRGEVIFSCGNWGGGTPETGNMLSQVFQIYGEEIKTVSASLDRGAFWRGYTHVYQEGETRLNARSLGEKLFPDMPVESANRSGDYLSLQWPLENGFTETYDTRFYYGLRILPEEEEMLRASEEHKSIFDFFDGATLTVTVAFDDGTKETQRYLLHTGNFQGTRDEETGLLLDLTENLNPAMSDNWVHGIRAERLDT